MSSTRLLSSVASNSTCAFFAFCAAAASFFDSLMRASAMPAPPARAPAEDCRAASSALAKSAAAEAGEPPAKALSRCATASARLGSAAFKTSRTISEGGLMATPAFPTENPLREIPPAGLRRACLLAERALDEIAEILALLVGAVIRVGVFDKALRELGAGPLVENALRLGVVVGLRGGDLPADRAKAPRRGRGRRAMADGVAVERFDHGAFGLFERRALPPDRGKPPAREVMQLGLQ